MSWRVLLYTSSMLSLVVGAPAAVAQSDPGTLPPVSVEPPAARRRPAAVARPTARPAPVAVQRQAPARRTAARSRPIPARVAAPVAAPIQPGPVERGVGPVAGLVATQTTSGTKTDSAIIETPQAVTVVGAEQINTLKATQSILEATRYTPGILSETFGPNPRSDFFLIRGFNAEQSGLYLNGLQLFSTAFATFKLDPFSLERIEVLRGPSSVLYGGSNPGGLLNAVSKRPTGQPFGYVEYGVNNFGNQYGAFDFEGPTAVNQYGAFSARLTGVIRGGGTQTNFVGDDRISISPTFTWQTNDTKFTFLGNYQRDSANSQNFLPYEGTVRRAAFGRIPTDLFAGDPNLDTFKRQQTLTGYEFEHRFADNLIFRQNFRYSTVSIDYEQLFPFGYVGPVTPFSAPLGRGDFIAPQNARILTIDNQVETRFDTGPLSHRVLMGADFKRYFIHDIQGFGGAPSIDVVNPVYFLPLNSTSARYRAAKVTQEQFGLYVQDQIKFDKFTLVLSGREDIVNTRTFDQLTPGNSNHGGDSAFSGRAGLIYTSDIGLAPYLSYSRSFVPQVGNIGSTTTPLAPEFGEQYEAGIKYQPFGNLGYIGASVFDLTRQNVVSSSPTNPLLTTQTGAVRSRGFELEAVANLTEGLKVIAAYTAYGFETTRTLDPTLLKKTLVNVPERFGSLFLDYTIPTGTFAGFGFGAGVRYVGHSFADAINTLKVPDRTVGDFTVHFERAGWRAAFNVNNFTDERYVSGCAGTTSCFYGDRRRFTGSLSYKW